MKLNRYREAFLDRFIKNNLKPSEEIFVICNSYKYSKVLRSAAACVDTPSYFRHLVAQDFNITKDSILKNVKILRQLERRKIQYFGTKLRERQYELLYKADKFPDQTISKTR